jgi:hypothetical protein
VAAFFLIALLAYSFTWLYLGHKRPLIHKKIVQLEAGNSGLNYGTGAESRLSSALRGHPFASTFRVHHHLNMGGGSDECLIEYNREQGTVNERCSSSYAGGPFREHEYLYTGVTDATLHQLASEGKFLVELPGLGCSRQIVTEKNLSKTEIIKRLPPSHPARRAFEEEIAKQNKSRNGHKRKH